MNTNYSISNSMFTMTGEFMITVLVIVILSVIVSVYNKVSRSELSIKVFRFGRLTAISISILEITARRTNVEGISIA